MRSPLAAILPKAEMAAMWCDLHTHACSLWTTMTLLPAGMPLWVPWRLRDTGRLLYTVQVTTIHRKRVFLGPEQHRLNTGLMQGSQPHYGGGHLLLCSETHSSPVGKQV